MATGSDRRHNRVSNETEEEADKKMAEEVGTKTRQTGRKAREERKESTIGGKHADSHAKQKRAKTGEANRGKTKIDGGSVGRKRK